MKRITTLFIVLFSVMALTVSAQKKLYYTQNPVWVEWADTPTAHPVPPEHATQPAVMLLNDVTIDYRLEGGYIVKHTTRHVVIKVLDDRGIERYSTAGITLNLGTKVPTIRARTISQSGRVQNIAKDRILLAINEQGHYVVVLPMEGIQKNSEIEYLVKEIDRCDFFGEERFQFDIPVAVTRFRMNFRKNMIVESKSFNGFPKLTAELWKNRMLYKTEVRDIPALLPEKNSFYDLHRMSFEYRVSYYTNDNEEKIKLNTFDNLSRKMFDEYCKMTGSEMKAVNQFLTDLGIRPNGNEAENIRKIEDGIKRNIVLHKFVDYEERKEVIADKTIRSMSVYSAGYDDTKDVLDTIINRKSASRSGYVKLFAACLTQAGIPHEIGWASDRTENRFDPEFESWKGLDYTVIYFPNSKRFLSPFALNLRYPVVEDAIAGSRGVFCTINKKGIVTGRLYKVRRITPLSSKDSRRDMNANLSFDKNMNATAALSYEWFGYMASELRGELPYKRPEQMKKFVAGKIEFLDNPGELNSYSFSNEDASYFYSGKPLSLYASVNATNLINKAGARYLVKVGDIIGHQENMYDDRPRVMPVDLKYPHSYNYTIVVNIPKGYKVLNPEAVRMNADYLNGELEQVIAFSSDYKLVKDNKNGDKFIISISENYTQLHFPTIEYERFRNVWNTAADFNGVALVLARK